VPLEENEFGYPDRAVPVHQAKLPNRSAILSSGSSWFFPMAHPCSRSIPCIQPPNEGMECSGLVVRCYGPRVAGSIYPGVKGKNNPIAASLGSVQLFVDRGFSLAPRFSFRGAR